MKFEYIIFLVILFNVVTAFLQKRAKAEKAKRLAEAAAANSLKPSQPAPKKAALEIRNAPEPEWDAEEEEEEDGEHAHSGGWHVEEEGEEHPIRRSQQIVRHEPEQPAQPTAKTKEKAATAAASPLPTAGSAGKKSIPFGLDAQKMREAVILREILDKPVSLRVGRFK